MKKFLMLILLIVDRPHIGFAQSMTDIRIISEDQKSLILEFTPKIQDEKIFSSNGTVFTRFSFFECQTNFDPSGNTDFFRALFLTLPSLDYSLQVIASEFQIKDSIRIIPKPRIKLLKDFGVKEFFDDTSYLKKEVSALSKPLAELVKVGKTGLGYVGTLVLHPIQDIGGDRVKLYTRIIIRLNFNGSFIDGTLASDAIRGNLQAHKQLLGKVNKYLEQTTINSFPLEQGNWYRIEVQGAGMYKLDYNYFRQLNITYNDIANCRIYGNGGLAIPDNKTNINPDSLIEISRLVIRKNGSGPSAEDYIIFYGRGTRGWRYTGSNTFQHYLNPFSEKNYYFFTFDQANGKAMDSISAVAGPPAGLLQTSFKEKILVENEKYNLLNSGKRWVGKLFSGADNIEVHRNSLPRLVPSSNISYSLNFLRRSSSTDYLYVSENNQPFIQNTAMIGKYIDGDEYASEFKSNGVCNSSAAIGDVSSVKIEIKSNNPDAKTWLDWLEIYYQRSFEALNDALIFTTPDLSGSIQYSVNGFSSNEVFAFDVTDHSNVKQITQLELDANDSTLRKFKLSQIGGTVKEIAIVGKNSLLTTSAATKIENSSLHNPLNQAEFVIIAPKEFLSAANKLKAHRESMPDPIMTMVVDINQIYNEFSCGIPDPLAIREFLNYAQNRWQTPPRYALLFGWGHFDYKNIMKTNLPNWIPTYETDESFKIESTYTSDDKFGIYAPGYPYSIAIGRIPARDINDATICVNKIISYETNSYVDPWRNRITFIADDGKTSEGDDGSIYTYDSEGIAENVSYTPSSFEKKKIYIVTYPTVNSSSGRRKPDANKAIVDAINQGSLITNYIGHGNERLWAHEAIFVREDNLPQIRNNDRLTFLIAATCSYGRYDDPKELSAAEKLITMENGGAIANVSAARVVYEGPNITLNGMIFSKLLFKDINGKFARIGDAWRYAKSTYLNQNSMKFHLFGDPTLRLLIPQDEASVDSINSISLATATSNIKIKSLEYVKIAGTVKQRDISQAKFNGTGTLQLFDSQKEINMQEGNGTFKFKVNGSPLYKGDVKVIDGQFESTIPIPKDVTFGKTARLSMYAWNNLSDGVGFTEKITIDGIDTTILKESDGPILSLYLDDYNFRPGDVVKSNPTLIVRLEDQSGINISTVGVGHQLLATINNPDRSYDLSGYYRSDLGTYKSGEIRFQLQDLADGKYTLRVGAWDIQNNSSESDISFEVCSGDDLTLLNVLNYPNPFSNSTTFTFQRNSVDPIDVEVKIYSVAGRLISKFLTSASGRSIRIPWDGRDNEGASLANGVYFYKLVIQNQINRQSREVIGKMAIIH